MWRSDVVPPCRVTTNFAYASKLSSTPTRVHQQTLSQSNCLSSALPAGAAWSWESPECGAPDLQKLLVKAATLERSSRAGKSSDPGRPRNNGSKSSNSNDIGNKQQQRQKQVLRKPQKHEKEKSQQQTTERVWHRVLSARRGAAKRSRGDLKE